ncbi:MAG: hypothetical protein GKC00_03910 [Candidatus Methanofastidiosa archaeon]|nr:hypothetical protein [Candidatus Methanofastidiosa archaeon]
MAEYVDLSLSYPTNAEKGEEIRITFEVINQSNDRLWDGTILIEESFMEKYGPFIDSERDYQNDPFKFSIVESGKSFKGEYVLSFKEEFPLKEARFDIILKCGKGSCRGGCRPFYLEKTVTIPLTEKRAEAVLKLDIDDFTVYRGDTLEVPFTIENTGNIQMTDITVEIKGDISSEKTLNISYLNPGNEISRNLLISIDENSYDAFLNPLILARFSDTSGKEGMTYKDIKINVIEKEKIVESNASVITNGIIETPESKTPSLLYFFLFLSIVGVIAVLIFVLYLFKR